MSSEVYVLADEGAHGYHDYLNFNVGADEGGSSTYHEAPSKGKTGKGKTKKATKQQPTSYRQSRESYNNWEDELSSLYPQYTSAATAEAEMLEESPNPKKIPPKQVAEHQQLILVLQKCAASQRFAPLLRDAGIKLTDIHTKSVAELKALKTRVSVVCLSAGGQTGMLAEGILLGCGAAEKMAPKKLVNLDGYQDAIRNDPAFAAAAELLEIDMGFAGSMSPMQQMMFVLAKNAATVNSMNRQKMRMMEDLMKQQHQMNMSSQSVPAQPTAPIVQSNVQIQQPASIKSNLQPMYD